MEPTTAVIRYRQDRLTRSVLAAVGPVTLGLWIAVIVQTGETEMVPVVVLLSAAIGAGTWWMGAAPMVAITPQALILRSLRGTTTLEWSDISALDRRWDVVWAMTSRGWFVLPVTGRRLAVGRPEGVRPLGDQVWLTWLERRGEHWGYRGLDPWRPDRDTRGRAVLRPPLLPRLGALTIAANALVWSLIPIRDPSIQHVSTQLGGAALVFVVTLAAILGYHRWARVTIDEHEIVTRSISRGVIRIPRRAVLEIRECAGGWWTNGKAVTHLGVVVAEPPPPPGSVAFVWPPHRVVALAAPVSMPLAWADDPAFYRIWAWLYDELLADDIRPATGAATEPHRGADR